MIGKTLSHYRVIEKIGAGGMGEVYRAHDERLERDVALKVLPAGTLSDESARQRFRKEALALSKLNHPNIATVFDFDTQDGVDFLVMELVEGVTLTDKLTAGALPEKEVARIGTQLAEGLAAAHDQRVVHRDLKPGNLRVTPDGRLKILDFGLAKFVRPVGRITTTEGTTESAPTEAMAGTLPYMAPEQLRGETVDARSDLWASGVVLYEMATGRRPFEHKLATALADNILHQPPTPPSQLNPKVSSRLQEIILKCLERNPEHRYQSARELLADFRRLGAAPVGISPTRPFIRAGGVSIVTQGGSLVIDVEDRKEPVHLTVPLWVVIGVPLAIVMAVLLLVLNLGGWRERFFGGSSSPAPIQSLAVLPLKNLSGDAEQEYFADGITEDIITELSRFREFAVIARNSSFAYKGRSVKVQDIGRELGVKYVVEGSVRRAADRVRVTAQLIDTETKSHIWADRYDRQLVDIFAIQDEVTEAIVARVADRVKGAATTLNPNGTVSVYCGDDSYFDYLYKFVTKGKYDAKNRAAKES